jgi:hypothetical protein
MKTATKADLRTLRGRLSQKRPPMTIDDLVEALPEGWYVSRREPVIVAKLDRQEKDWSTTTYYASGRIPEDVLQRVRSHPLYARRPSRDQAPETTETVAQENDS